MKKRIFLLFLSAMMLCMANVPLYAAAVIPDGIIIEENFGGEDELMPMGASGCGMTSAEARLAAAALGYTVVSNVYSHGQLVFYNGKQTPHYISADVDAHNGGVWKGANTIDDLHHKSTRLGAYDADLNRIGD